MFENFARLEQLGQNPLHQYNLTNGITSILLDRNHELNNE